MERTRVAVLGTLAEFQRQPIPFDLPALVKLVSDLNPDLLCLDITPQQWQRRDFGDLPPEYREALLPLAHQTDIVVVPIAEAQPPQEPVAPGWRGRLIALLRQWLAAIQRTAPGPAAINQGWRHDLANVLYHLIAALAGGGAGQGWQTHRAHLSRQVLETARRDPGRRILVVVNVRHCHHIRPALKQYPEIEIVPYSEL
ncbi:MAG: hypothetical protein ACE5H9_20875 [Anaerolineae bacterium]